jgi:hypothetical protein
MEDPQKILVKASIFGIVWPLLWIPLSHRISDWAAAAVVGVITTLLFHWLPPRIHAGLTVAKSVALSLAAGLAGAAAVFLVDRVF